MVPTIAAFSLPNRDDDRRRARTRSGRQRVGGTEHGTAGLDGLETLPNHGDDGAGRHVLDEAREEGLVAEVVVV
jgi:hypothetical protein